jgi:hypothetical protein
VRDLIRRGAATGGGSMNRGYIAKEVLDMIVRAGYTLRSTTPSSVSVTRLYELVLNGNAISRAEITLNGKIRVIDTKGKESPVL